MKELEKKVAEAELKKVKDEILTYTERRPLRQAWKSSIRFSVGIADLDAIMQAVSLCNTMKKR